MRMHPQDGCSVAGRKHSMTGFQLKQAPFKLCGSPTPGAGARAGASGICAAAELLAACASAAAAAAQGALPNAAARSSAPRSTASASTLVWAGCAGGCVFSCAFVFAGCADLACAFPACCLPAQRSDSHSQTSSWQWRFCTVSS